MKNNKTKLLKKYRINQAELLDLECRLQSMTVRDSVQSSSRFPYSKHSVTLEGVLPCEDADEIQYRIIVLKSEISDAENLINSIPQYWLRKAAQMYYLWPILTKCEEVSDSVEKESWDHKPDWNDVADKIGSGVTVDCIKASLNRILKKI